MAFNLIKMNWIKRYFKKRKIKAQIKFNNERIAVLNNSYFYAPNELIIKQANKILDQNSELSKQLKR